MSKYYALVDLHLELFDEAFRLLTLMTYNSLSRFHIYIMIEEDIISVYRKQLFCCALISISYQPLYNFDAMTDGSSPNTPRAAARRRLFGQNAFIVVILPASITYGFSLSIR